MQTTNDRATTGARRARAFTLVEIMIVVLIIGITLGVGVPAFVRAFDKNELQQAEAGIISLCSTARLMAITQRRPVDLVVRLVERSFMLVPVEEVEVQPTEEGVVEPGKEVPAAEPVFLPKEVQFSISANSQSFEDDREVRVRFFPDATCEELTLTLESSDGRRRLSLEVTTALVDIQNPD